MLIFFQRVPLMLVVATRTVRKGSCAVIGVGAMEHYFVYERKEKGKSYENKGREKSFLFILAKIITADKCK